MIVSSGDLARPGLSAARGCPRGRRGIPLLLRAGRRPAGPGAAAHARRVLPGPAGRRSGRRSGRRAGQAGPGRGHRSRPAAVLPRAGPGRAAAGPAAGRTGHRRPGVRPGRPGPVPGHADPRRVPRPGRRPRHAGPARPGRRGHTQVRARRSPGRHPADVRRLLGHRRRRVPLHLAPDLAPGTRHPGRTRLRLRRPRVHHHQRRRRRDRRRHHPRPGQGRAQRP